MVGMRTRPFFNPFAGSLSHEFVKKKKKEILSSCDCKSARCRSRAFTRCGHRETNLSSLRGYGSEAVAWQLEASAPSTGHSRTLICFFLSHSFVALAVCFGSLSCWKTYHPRPIFSALTEGRRLSPKISRYMAPFILPSIQWSHPVPLAKKHPKA